MRRTSTFLGKLFFPFKLNLRFLFVLVRFPSGIVEYLYNENYYLNYRRVVYFE